MLTEKSKKFIDSMRSDARPSWETGISHLSPQEQEQAIARWWERKFQLLGEMAEVVKEADKPKTFFRTIIDWFKK